MPTLADSIQLLVQTGALGLLWLVLRSVRDVVSGPAAAKVLELGERGIAAFTRLEAKVDGLDEAVSRLDGRGVCPILEARAAEVDANGRRATEPEVT